MSLKRYRKRKDESGQSTVEFALTLVFLMAFVLFFIQLSFVFAFGNYVHYATFMSARALESAGMSPEDQKQRAQEVLTSMVKRSSDEVGLDKFPTIARAPAGGDIPGALIGQGEQFQKGSRDLSWMQGVRYTFRSRIFLLPLAGKGSAQGPASRDVNSVTLTSESWLGREPSWDECQKYMGTMNGLFDNGC